MPTLVILIVFISVVLWRRFKFHVGTSRLPPGPVRLPFVGNAFQVPVEYAYKTFAAWGKIYGDLIYLKMFGTSVLVIDSVFAARELLEKRAAIYSSRPHSVLWMELMERDNQFFIFPYKDQFKKHQKWTHMAFLDKTALQSYQGIQYMEASKLVDGLISSESAEDVSAQCKRYSGAMLLKVVYDYTVTSVNDKWIEMLEEVTTGAVHLGLPGANIVDIFPPFKHIPTWMPGAALKREALRVGRATVRASTESFEMVKNAVLSGACRPCIVASLIERAMERGTLEEESHDIQGLGITIYGAGRDTTSIALETFLFNMVLHPRVLRKAQEEMDRVIGLDRLPTFEDRSNLPYLDCILKEVLRWNPPVPLGLPHSMSENDDFNGFSFPKGTTVIANIWSMFRNSDVYPEPEEFRPERYQRADGKTVDVADPTKIVYGFGRRICPGRLFADANIWLAMAYIVATLHLRKAKDSTGREITPRASFSPIFTSHVLPFECSVVPRSTRALELVANARY